MFPSLRNYQANLFNNSFKIFSPKKPAAIGIFPLNFKRAFNTKLPIMFINREEHRRDLQKLKKISQEFLIKKNATAMLTGKVSSVDKWQSKLEYRLHEEKLTANLYAWQLAKGESSKQDGLGGFEVQSDKEFLITRLSHFSDKQTIKFSENVSVINEGCDNGDFLSLLVPLLFSNNVNSIKILLTNGNNEKLMMATELATRLLAENNISYMITDAYEEIPDDKLDASYQRVFIFFRLGITDHIKKISRFVEQRIEVMRKDDIAVGCFLKWDTHAKETLCDSYKFELESHSLEKGHFLLKRHLPPNVKKQFIHEGGSEENSTIHNTAFTLDAVQKLIGESGGTILDMQEISSTTDNNKPITVIGTIFKKK